MSGVELAARALCALPDVIRLVPGYQPTDETTEVLIDLINAESVVIYQQTGREFVALTDPATRLFEVSGWVVRHRRIRIGDWESVSTVKILDEDELTVLETVAAADRVLLPRVRDEWEPVRQIRFLEGSASPASYLACGRVVEVTGTPGFPAVPDSLRVASAKMVLVRYVNDAAEAGTSLAEALAEQGFNTPVALASAQAVIRSFATPTVA